MRLKEWQRTILLVALLLAAAGYIYWTQQSIETNFVDTLR